MKASLKAGLSATRHWTIDEMRTIDFMGPDVRVYATPRLVHDIEMTCHDFLREHLDPGEDSVGTRIELDHMGATLLGMWVDITVTIASVEGRAVGFEIAVADAIEPVAKGRHARFVADVEKTKARLKVKAGKAGL